MYKKSYNGAEIEIFYFGKKDIITASGNVMPTIEDPNQDEITPD